MTDILSGGPPFTLAGVTFTCWVTGQSALPGTSRYVWRDATNRLAVGRTGGVLWASVDGKPVRGQWVLLSQAMRAAIVAGSGMRRAA